MQNQLLIAAGLALLLAASPALGAHMTNYATNPVEHDDQGRSNEPDGARGGLYDGAVGDCSVDVTGDGRCTAADLALWPAGEVAAQGCTDDAGRKPSGLCGLATVGVGTGLTGTLVPPGTLGSAGGSGPCLLPAGQRPVRVLDVRQLAFPLIGVPGGHVIVDVNRKLQDAGAFAVERQLGGEGSDVLVGGVAMMAWYGLFFDKNCNGVIDHSGGQQADPRNEFTWFSDTCRPYTGGPRVVPDDVCLAQPTEFLGWEVPGNHHAFFGGPCVPAVCGTIFIPADVPGRLVLCAALGGTPESCDGEEAAAFGDPLLGPQGSSAPDWYFFDYTGDPFVSGRTYVAALNWPMYHYDPSVIVTSTVFGAVNAPQSAEGDYDLNQAALVDVDVLKTRNPALEAYVQGLVKPTLRSAWLTLREAL